MKKLDTSYTQMPNYHLRDKTLSLKAKGLLSLMLSLPAEWDYSVAGLTALSNDGKAGISTAMKELEEHGYLKRDPIKFNGKFVDWNYIISPTPFSDFPQLEKPQLENRTQIITNKINTKKINTKEYKENAQKKNQNEELVELLNDVSDDKSPQQTKQSEYASFMSGLAEFVKENSE